MQKRDMTPQNGKGKTTKNDTNSSVVSSLDGPNNDSLFIQQPPFEILSRFGNHLKRLRPGKVTGPNPEAAVSASCCQELSSESIVQIANMRALQHTSHGTDDHECVFLSDLTSENTKDGELSSSLLTAAELFSKRQFDCAEKLLNQCILLSSPADNHFERVVRYFAKALLERIDLERGKIDLEKITFHIEDCLTNYQPAIVAAVHNLPSPQIIQFTAIQALLDSIGTAKKIHLVDFGINNGMHGSIMIQGLANRKNVPLELLKITAIGNAKDRLQETGNRLSSFAASMNLPFLYKPLVSETDLREDSVELDADEVVAVYFGLYLWLQLVWPNHLRSVIQFVKKLNPCVMVVNEFEASTNNPIFIDRFHGAFSFMAATFDCVDTCLTRDNVVYRKIIEEVFFWDGIRNMITAEDEERTHRHAKIGFWRELFAEFGFSETEFSNSSLYQASLLIKGNESWNSCSLVMDGKCMIVGWKGTPLQSVSAWKISDQKI